MGGCRRPKAFYICALRQANQTSLTRSRVTKHPLHVERKGQSTHTKGRAVHEEDKHGKHVRAGHCLLVVNDIYSCVLLYVCAHECGATAELRGLRRFSPAMWIL